MTLNEYQRLSRRTAGPAHTPEILALGLAGESGEVCDLIKKSHERATPVNLDAILLELGDTLWYLSNLSGTYGWTLAEVAQANIEKLAARYPPPVRYPEAT